MQSIDYDYIAGYHIFNHTCGVAKFNNVLASMAAIYHINWFDEKLLSANSVLLSIKTSEFGNSFGTVNKWLDFIPKTLKVDLFLHEYNQIESDDVLIERANRVFCGNIEIYESLKHRTKCISAWCPSTIIDASFKKDTKIRLFSFGMAHKLQLHQYQKLKNLFQSHDLDYTLHVSTAVHEGYSIEDSFNDVNDQLKEIFRERCVFLGFLSDQAVCLQLESCDYFVAFFEKGARSNNTTIHTAIDFNRPIITNLDDYSPKEFRQSTQVLDIDKLPKIGKFLAQPNPNNPNSALKSQFSWENLLNLLAAK